MRLVVFGAHTPVGRALVSQAVALGHEVQAIVRDDVEITAPPGMNVMRVRAITADRVAMLAADADAVLSMLGPDGEPDGFATRASSAIVEGMERAGVERLVTLGTAELCSRDLHASGDGLFRDHLGALRVLESSTRRWTVICPPSPSEGPATGRYREAVEGLPAGATKISTGDVAHAALRALGRDELVHQRLGVAL